MSYKADVPAIRQWLGSQIAPPGRTEITRDLWPKCIQDLNPKAVMLNADGSVWMVWGSGFHHYGVIIGSPFFTYSNADEYVIELEPGAYVWAQAR
jgi:hypothetical protein